MRNDMSAVNAEIRRLGPVDGELVRQADFLFDHPSQGDAVVAFLESPANYLLIAYVDGSPAGFVKAYELRRIDDLRPMLFLYEVGVDESYQGRGIGTALVREIARLGEANGCREMFVLTNEANEPAMRMYASAGGERNHERDIAMFEWEWDEAVH